jgi:UDP-N-acetylmuramoylalanine-D-glutamate ligase
MKSIKILICKLAIFGLKLFGRGGSFPGSFGLILDKKMMNYFKMPKLVIAVTGSAGKGSTTTIIAKVLRKSGYKVGHNFNGGNMNPGILTTLIDSSNLKGESLVDALVLEIDERYTKEIFDIVNPNYVIVTNICRDQPPRHGNFDLVYEKIREALNSNMKLVLNGDDPYLRKFNLNNEFEVTYYSIDKNKYSYKENKFNNINIYYCPECNNKLKYNYYHIESIGDYYCDKCGFKKPDIKYLSEVNLDKKYMNINGNKIDIKFDILYYAYNILAAYSILSLVGIEDKKICEYISEIENNSKLNNSYKYNNRNVYVMSSKAENSTTYNQSVLFTSNKKVEKTIVIGWKEISRRYEHNDISWLYDVEFELLNNELTNKVICVGPERFDIATRIKYAGIDESKIEIYNNLEEAQYYIKNKSKGDIFAILNFDYVKPFNNVMKED